MKNWRDSQCFPQLSSASGIQETPSVPCLLHGFHGVPVPSVPVPTRQCRLPEFVGGDEFHPSGIGAQGSIPIAAHELATLLRTCVHFTRPCSFIESKRRTDFRGLSPSDADGRTGQKDADGREVLRCFKGKLYTSNGNLIVLASNLIGMASP